MCIRDSLLKRGENDVWETLVKPGKKAKPGTRISFGDGLLVGEVVDVVEEGNRLIHFEYKGIFEEILDQLGQMPLPPYITHQLEDRSRYNTVYAAHEGSAAAPTAGLHFTPKLLKEIQEKGVDIARAVSYTHLDVYKRQTYANVIDAVEQVFPTSVQGFIRSIVTQVYFSQSAKIIPITILVALWSAGRGVLSVTAGLNCIYGNTETRNYVYLRLRASLYTVIFILAIVLSLVLSVFGNSISAMIYKHAPFWSTLMQYIITVSYTHLDVYKRQIQHLESTSISRCIGGSTGGD